MSDRSTTDQRATSSIVDPLARYASSLAGQLAVVSGGGSGIGQAVAVALARAGADVALLGRRRESLAGTAKMVTSRGARCTAHPCDVTNPLAVDAAITGIVRDVGTPDIVVAAAGVNAWGAIEMLDPSALQAALATNVAGIANLIRASLPSMRLLSSGKIIVIASDSGRHPEGGGSGYVASKFGAVGLALSISQELYASGISVHVIEPGCVDTDWYPRAPDVPRSRMLSPDDVALAALFLATLPNHIVVEELMLVPRGLLIEPWE